MNEKVKIDPSLEDFFLGVAMVHGTNPLPRYGLERTQLASEIISVMVSNNWEPSLLQKVRSNYRELGGRLLDTDPTWFYTRLADAYLDWLYGQNAEEGAEHPGEIARKDSDHDPRLERDDERPWVRFWET